MALIALVCPNCNAPLDADEGREFIFCSYCGTKIVLQKESSSEVRINRDDEVAKWYSLAEMFVINGDRINAYIYASKVVETSTDHVGAWLIKTACTASHVEAYACLQVLKKLTDNLSRIEDVDSRVIAKCMHRINCIPDGFGEIEVTFNSLFLKKCRLELCISEKAVNIRPGETKLVSATVGEQKIVFRIYKEGFIPTVAKIVIGMYTVRDGMHLDVVFGNDSELNVTFS